MSTSAIEVLREVLSAIRNSRFGTRASILIVLDQFFYPEAVPADVLECLARTGLIGFKIFVLFAFELLDRKYLRTK